MRIDDCCFQFVHTCQKAVSLIRIKCRGTTFVIMCPGERSQRFETDTSTASTRTCRPVSLQSRKMSSFLTRMREWGIESPRLWPRLAAELSGRTKSQLCRRWRQLDPNAYDKRRRALKDASKSQTTAVFRPRSIHRQDPRFRK